jgi:protein involved in polysaccharide export with SLBB domain
MSGGGPGRLAALTLLFAVCALNGCAAISNPTVDGIPVRRLPPEVFGESRETMRPIQLTALRQKPPEAYLLGPGDVLGVYIEGVLGEKGQPPPVRIPEQSNLQPALGYPLPVRENGTVPLPLINPVKVEDLTLADAQAKIVEAYTVTKKILQPGRDRIIITLIQPRKYNVLVLREDAGGTTFGTQGGFGPGVAGGTGTFFQETRKAAGFSLQLPAYENDLLNALTRSGGLPGPEAEEEVIIERGAYSGASDPGGRGGVPPNDPAGGACSVEQTIRDVQGRGSQTLRIPLRLRPGQSLNVRPQDIVLQNGDVVLVRLRRGEYFYCGGLLPPRIFPLPRDRDLDILQAVALVGGPLVNGGVNANNLSGSLVQSGLGFASPSQLAIVRKTETCGQLTILVDLNRALRDPRERILVQAGDVLILQQTVNEGFGQWFTTNFRFDFTGFLVRQRDFIFTSMGTMP